MELTGRGPESLKIHKAPNGRAPVERFVRLAGCVITKSNHADLFKEIFETVHGLNRSHGES